MSHTRRKPMQVSVENILAAHGKLAIFSVAFILDFERLHPSQFCLELEQPGYDNLVIEKVGSARVAVAHYFIQNGDAMWDPEIVFSYPDFIPLEITQSPMGVYRSRYVKRDGKTYVDSKFHSDVSELVRVWAKNLRHQNWDQAKIVAELPNPEGGETE